VAIRIDENAEARREVILAGIGVHFLPCFEGDALPALRRIGEIQHPFGRDLWLLTLRELRRTSRIRALLDHLEAAIRAPGKA
jgi:DNA-binding transcriptional LysR family regulator